MMNACIDEEWAQIESEAVRLAQEAGQIALRYFQHPMRVEFKMKGEKSPVTQADREVETFLRESITGRFPSHAVLGEEQPDVPLGLADYLWVLDPVDGTANFANGLPLWSISIGVLYRARPVIGCLFLPPGNLAAMGLNPVMPQAKAEESGAIDNQVEGGVASPPGSLPHTGALLYGRRGGGVFLDGQKVVMPPAEMPVPYRLAGLPAFHARRYYYDPPLAKRLGEVRSLGSISYEMALVALGGFQYAVFGAPKIWDVAAGVVLVQEAGGHILFKEKREVPWQDFERFFAPIGKKGKQGTLADWSAPLIAGAPGPARFVAEHLHRRASWSRAGELLWKALRPW